MSGIAKDTTLLLVKYYIKFMDDYNEGTLQDFITYLLNKNIIEIDMDSLNVKAFNKLKGVE